MTRTELDLRECFAERADSAHDATAVLQRIGRRRRRVPVPLMAAAAVVTVVALALWQLGGVAPSTHTPPGTGDGRAPDPGLLDYGMRLDPAPPGYAIASRNLTRTTSRVVYDAARATGTASGTADAIEAVVYGAGAFDPTSVRTGTPVSVGGGNGWYGPASGHVVNGSGRDGDGVAASVAWEYADHSWAVVTGTAGEYQSRAVELAIANTVHPGQGEAVRVPFLLGTAPSGLAATRLDTRIDTAPVSASVGFGTPTSVTVDAMYVRGGPVDAALGNGQRRTVAGHPATLTTSSAGGAGEGHRLVIVWDNWLVDVSGAPSVATEELIAIADGLTLAAGDDPATWYTAADSLG